MPIKVKASGAWKDAVPKVNVGGAWKAASSFVKAGGLWYQASSNGLNIIIDSATTLYDFNLKAYMQGAGIWPASGPVVINELRITARTVITQNVGSEVVDFELRYNNATPFRPAPRGYKVYTHIVNGASYGHQYYQENPDLYPAFTTGDGWPVGSIIQKFIVEGLIYGKGADGLGTPKTYNARRENSDGSVILSSQDISTSGDGFMAMTLRHGYPALAVTVPIVSLQVAGGVYGGGASSACIGLTAAPAGTVDANSHPVPIADWPARLTAEYLITQPITIKASSNGVTTPYYGFARGVLWPTTSAYGLLSICGFGFHGGGGGQGGGVGANPIRTPTFMSGANAGFIAGREPLAGGDGTVGAVGAGSTAPVEYYDNDSKYGGGESVMAQSSAALSGCSWGAELSSSTFLTNYVAAGAGRAPVPPTTVALITEGMHQTRAHTRIFFSKSGAAILGAANVTSYTSLTQIKGKRL